MRSVPLASRAGLLAAVVVVASATPVGAAGQGALTAQPARTGQGSNLVLSASGLSGNGGSSLPQGITVQLFRGFHIDPSAVVGRCSEAQATSSTCPADARVATGMAMGSFSVLGMGGPFTATITAWLAPPSGSDLADVVVELDAVGQRLMARGQLTTVADPVYGFALRFDPLPTGSLPPGSSATLSSLTLTAGASSTRSTPTPRRRRHRARRCRSRHGHRCVSTHHRKPTPPHRRARIAARTTTANLIVNPASCLGTWPAQLLVRYSDHTDTTDLPIACSG